VQVNDVNLAPMVFVYDKHIGDYAKIKNTMDTVFYRLKNNTGIETTKGFGLYYDNPRQVPKNELRSLGGCILDRNTTSLVDSLIVKGFKIGVFPQTKALVVEFPLNGGMSIMLGIFKVYPKLGQYMAQHKIPSKPIMELYDVPNKKIRELSGQPLIARTIEHALSTKFIDRVVVSTDAEKIANIASQYGAEVPFLRPQSLATDDAPKLPVVKHAVKFYIENLKFTPDYVIDLDPTSPLRTLEDIERSLTLIMNDSGCDSVITGYRSNKNPYFNMVEINSEGFADLCKKTDDRICRRQDAPVVYAMNASIYVWKTDVLFQQAEIISGKVKFVEMPENRSIDIDSETDFRLVELLLEERHKQ